MSIFTKVRATKLKKNPFNLSHDVLLTTEFGRLTPVLKLDVVPGDTVKRLSTEHLLRMAPLAAPTMARCNVFMHYFFVPNRLLMDDWDTFITGGKNGDSMKDTRSGTSLVEKPYAFFGDLESLGLDTKFLKSELPDYLGFPVWNRSESIGFPLDQKVDLLPFKAYQLIYNTFYRDENFQDEVDILKDINGDTVADVDVRGLDLNLVKNLFELRYRNWQKDYFTSALPFPQRGAETTLGEGDYEIVGDGRIEAPVSGNSATVDGRDVASILDLRGSGSITVNEFRRAMAIQKFKEKLARFGYRLPEFLLGLFGVRPSDATLQRPQFIGGTVTPLKFGEVLQTSEDNVTPLGTMAGRGISAGVGKNLNFKVKEHGFIFGIMSVMPHALYMQGLSRLDTKFDRFDYFTPDFANIGEQEILEKELVLDMQGEPDRIFGYQSRYSEYKFKNSSVHGDFRASLLNWHMGRQFADGDPHLLNSSFLQVSNRELDRVFSVTDPSYGDHLWLQMYHDILLIRPMPKFGTPSI